MLRVLRVKLGFYCRDCRGGGEGARGKAYFIVFLGKSMAIN